MRYCLRFLSHVLLITVLVVTAMLGLERAFAQEEDVPLSPGMINQIQERYQGRVVGVMPHKAGAGESCHEFSKNIRIDGKSTSATGLACKDQGGSWKTVNYYDVQVLTRQGRIVLLTVDAVSGEIIKVRE